MPLFLNQLDEKGFSDFVDRYSHYVACEAKARGLSGAEARRFIEMKLDELEHMDISELLHTLPLAPQWEQTPIPDFIDKSGRIVFPSCSQCGAKMEGAFQPETGWLLICPQCEHEEDGTGFFRRIREEL